MTRNVYDEYVAGRATAFYGAPFGDPAARGRAVERAVRPLSPDVADVLDEQNASLVASPARDRHLAALRDGAAAVVTGQQVGLFLGPLYTISKAASAVATARALSQECGRPVVPVFWLQTEDHDLAEIAECHLPRAIGDPLTLRLPSSADDRVSIEHLSLPASVAECVAALEAELSALPSSRAHLDRIARHYRPGAGWSTAFAGLLAELFADEGLVLIDPRDPPLTAAAAPVHRRALESSEDIAGALLERVRLLEAQGFKATVHVRPGAPLSFIHPEGPAGPRYRLAPAAGGFQEVGGTRVHAAPALLAALETDAFAFSTSVLLRPILQDTLLPTAIFIGGPAEVAYFAQLAPLYDAYGMAMPVVLPRASFRLLEDKTSRLLERLHLVPGDEARPEDELLATARGTGDDGLEALSERLLNPFDRVLTEARPRLVAEGEGLDGAIDKTRATVAAAVAKLVAKVDRARLHRDESIVRDVLCVKQSLYPKGTPQERFYSLPYFAARYGEQAVVQGMIDAVDPFRPGIVDLHLA